MKKVLLNIISAAIIMFAFFVIANGNYFKATIYYYMFPPQPPAVAGPQMQLGANSLFIPSLNIAAPIVYATEASESIFQLDLQNGVVHYPQTANPGQAGNCYIFGHSSDFLWSKGHYKTVFTTLPNLKIGDVIYLTDGQNHQFVYQVTQTKVVSPQDTEYLSQDNTKALLTLQTSYPLGTALERFLVIADKQ